MPRVWSIYTLSDPNTHDVRYVGWAFDPAKRLRDHVTKARGRHTHKDNWINLLAAGDTAPLLAVVETGTGSWATAERRWIAHFRAAGANLTNATDGGEGVPGIAFSAETRERMAAAKRGRPLAPAHVAKVVAATRGKRRSHEVVMAIGARRRGAKHTPETIERLRVATTGYRHTPEARAKIAAASKGRRHTEETRAKQRAAKVGKSLTPEHREKLAAAKRGKPLSEAHKDKLRAGGGWKHTPEALEKIRVARRARVKKA